MNTQTAPAEETRTLVIERDFAHSPAKLWRALTESPLLAQWLLNNDFTPEVGHTFQFRSEPVQGWNGIIDCKVLLVDPITHLSYTWGSMGMSSVVVFTLTPSDAGTHMRMEHSGFGPNQDHAYKGAMYGWQNFLGKLETLLGGLD